MRLPHDLSEYDMRRALAQAIEQAGSMRRFAKASGVNPSLISLASRGKVPVGPKLLEALKLERVVSYRRVK